MERSDKLADRPLRVLAADEDEAALASTADMLRGLGHEVVALAVDVRTSAKRVAEEDPDLAVVVLDADDEHALALVSEIASYASGPVIALLDREDPEFVEAAAERGLGAWARTDNPASMQSAIEVALRRHAERDALTEQVNRLESALERRAVIERAKGILMERHGVAEREAFELLRSHARGHGRTVVATAAAVCDGHGLLPKRP